MSMKEDFKKFAMRGNVMDMAVGVIIGGAFGKIVSSLVNDVVMPPLGMALGKMDFSNLFISLNGKEYATLEAAKKWLVHRCSLTAASLIPYWIF